MTLSTKGVNHIDNNNHAKDERSPLHSNDTGFNSREKALLEAWDRSNTQEVDEAFKQRLLAAFEETKYEMPSWLEDNDRELCLEMAADCQAEVDAESAAAQFHEIAEKHEWYLYRVAARLSGDADAAKDLVQETLTRALLHFGQFKTGTNARSWLVTILTRLYYDVLKHERVISRAEGELKALASIGYEFEVSSIPDTQLWAAVNALTPEMRRVVESCYIQQMSYKAIAEELRVPIGTIGTRLRRARQRLKVLLNAAA